MAGEKVTIPAGRTIVLDVDPPRLGGLTIEGTLVAEDRDLALTSESIMVMKGRLQIGSEEAPFKSRATITLTGEGLDSGNHDMGARVLGVMDGVLDMHGDAAGRAWTRLSREAAAGDLEIEVLEAPGWKAGDRLVLAASGPDQGKYDVAEVASITGTKVRLKQPLMHAHYGTPRMVGQTAIDVRTEVARLNRNIVIQGDADSDTKKLGAHMMFMALDKATVRLSQIEVTRAGQLNKLGRYPIHFHLMANRCVGCYVREASVHNTVQRGYVVHDSAGVRLEKNVAFNTVGHNYIVETETTAGNTFDGNLAMVNRMPMPAITLPALKQQNDDIPAGFWVKNGRNVFTNNHVAGSTGMGMWFDEIKGGPLVLEKNTVHAAMTAGADRDFNMQSGVLIHCREEQPATAKVTDLLVYQNGGTGAKNPAGFWPEACTKYSKNFAAFEMTRIYAVDNAVTNIELRHQPDVYTMTDAIMTGNLLGGEEKGSAVFAQYGGTATLVRPTFAHYKSRSLFSSNDILGVWIARFRIQDARFVEVDRAAVVKPVSLTEALDDSFLPRGSYFVQDGEKPTLIANQCARVAEMASDHGVFKCPEAKVGFLIATQNNTEGAYERVTGGTPLHTVMNLTRNDGAVYVFGSYGFGGYEIAYGPGMSYSLARQPSGTLTVRLDAIGSVTTGVDEAAVVEVAVPFAGAPKGVFRTNEDPEGAKKPGESDRLQAVTSKAALDSSGPGSYFYDAGAKMLRVKATRQWLVIQP